MGIFSFFKKQKNANGKSDSKTLPPIPSMRAIEPGNTQIEYIKLTKAKCNAINKFFIAFDLETTGLSPQSDRIIEIGAIAFENGKPVEEFSTLVNPGRPIPAAATAVNGITNEMVKTAPDERAALQKLLSFFDRYSGDDLVFVGHNANFDFSFLKNALNRYGITREFRYFDTLYASRSLIKGLSNYKQDTVAAHFGLVNQQAHRAASDALVCGNILLHLAPNAKRDPKEFYIDDKNIPSREEMQVCAYLQKLILESGGSPDELTYYKHSNGYVTISSFYEIARFKFAKKGHYLIVDKSVLKNFDNPTEDCTSSEGGAGLSRAFFTHPAQLSGLNEYFYEKYQEACRNRVHFFEVYPFEKDQYYTRLPDMIQLPIEKMDQLINELDPTTVNTKPQIKQDPKITRGMVKIDVPVTRKPLSQIKNRNNWERGYNKGFPIFEIGDAKRKKGTESEILEAIALLDKARENGLFTPSLYESYAKAYRKLKDYQNEIIICDEGITRFLNEPLPDELNPESNNWIIGDLTARRDKAIQLLYKQQNPKAKH